ncbi:MAG: hypothetical protein LKK08_06095 [Bacteroidales bacterium]|nr:hypothetical protein [Bacteroidales bacterium]
MEKTKTRQNLKTFYAGMKYGKYELARRIADRCGVSLNTACYWMRGNGKPGKETYYKVLAEETGIPEEDLFNRELNHDN